MSLPKSIDRDDPDDVALAFAINLELWDTRIDNRSNDVTGRAVEYATPKFGDAMTDGAPVAPPGHDWNTLANHDGYTTVKAQLGGIGQPPPDTTTTAYRAVAITNHTMRNNDGWTQPGPSKGTLYILELQAQDDTWAVAGYQLQ